MYPCILAFLAGVLACQSLAALPAAPWAVLVLALPPLWRRGCVWRVMAALLAGLLWAWLRAALALHPTLPTALEGRDLVLAGRVAERPQRIGRVTRFLFDVHRLDAGPAAVPFRARVRLGWYGQAPVLAVGQAWRLRVRLKRPHGFFNPGGTDYEGRLLRAGIRATGYVRGVVSGPGPPAGYPIARLRSAAGARITALTGSHAGVLRALTLGERDGITADQWRLLRATGTSHLLAISGLHIGLVAGLVFTLVRRLWSVWPGAAARLAAPRAGAVAALASAAGYSTLAGLAIPTQRALVMVAVVMGAVALGREVPPLRSLALALLAVLLLDPLAVLAPGFWLSFLAVAAIFWVLLGRGPEAPWRRWGRLQLAVSLGLLPLLLLSFQQTALVAPLANLLAVPWVGLLVVPLALLGVLLLAPWPWAGTLCLQGAGILGAQVWPVLDALAAVPGAVWHHGAPGLPALLAALAGIAWLLAPRGLPGRTLGLLLCLPLLAAPVPRPPPGAVRFTLLDVGQGLAAVVRTRHHTLVYDTGARFGPDFDAGAAVVVPFLRSRGVTAVNLLIVSHGDNDHAGGVPSLLAALPVYRVLSSVPDHLPAARASRCAAGQHWRWDGVVFRILSPPPGDGLTGNNASCVLQVEAGGRPVLLLPGDIEAPAEARLLAAGAALAAAVIVVPHHGSGTSSTPAFIAATAPDYALFATGYRNRYGFPRPRIVVRYRRAGAALLDTAREGAVTITVDATGRVAPPVAWRRRAGHYWNARE